ncbi:6602_t:CDS:2, partial [Dentiscutata heterogama]
MSDNQDVVITTTTDENIEPVLSEELQKAYNALPSKCAVSYYNLRDNTAKVAFFESIIAVRKDERKK